MTPACKYPLWVPPSGMLTQWQKRQAAARPDKPQYPYKARKLTTVRAIPVRPDAEAFIREYEYLGALGAATRAAYGLFMPDGELLGVECFGVLPGDRLAKRLCPDDPSRVVCLERGACVPWAPRSSAGRLIKYAIEQAHRDRGWEVFVAYADENAGEIGGVYRGSGDAWLYLGRDVGRGGKPYREAVIPPGRTVPVQTRMRRKAGLTREEAKAAGWRFVIEPTKHVFVRFASPRAADLRRRAEEQFGVRDFPTRGVAA